MFRKAILPFLVIATIIIITFLAFGNLEVYFVDLLNSLKQNPSKYAVISTLVLLSDIVLPVPSSIVLYTNGYVLGIGAGFIVSFIALFISSIIGYYIGSFTSLGLQAKSDLRTDQLLSKYGAITIIITRGIPILSESVCILCGYNRMPLKQYLIYNLIGSVPIAFLYSLCGSLAYNENTFLLSFGASVLLSASFWFFGKHLLKFNTSDSGVHE